MEWNVYFAAGHCPAGKTYEDTVLAAVEEHWSSIYQLFLLLSTAEFFYNLPAEPDRELLELQIQGMYRQIRLAYDSGENG